MKYFSAIVAAFLCAAVVSAAPSTPNPSYEELALSPYNKISDKAKHLLDNVICMWKSISDEIPKGVFPGDWRQSEAEFHKIVTEEWGKCIKIASNLEHINCELNVARTAFNFVNNFLKKVQMGYKELYKRIRSKSMECHGEVHTFASLPEQFECFIDALRKVSIDNGLEEQWSKTEPLFKSHLESWKECANAGSKFAVIFCNIQQGITTMTIMTDYIREMAAANPKTVQDFMRAIQQFCQGQGEEEVEFALMLEAFDDKNEKEKLQCIVKAIGDAVKETDFKGLYEQMMKELANVFDRLKKCTNEQNDEARLKCARKEMMRGREIIMKFLIKMREASKDTLDRIRDLVKQRCFA